MYHNFLKLNGTKSEVLLVGTPTVTCNGKNFNLDIGNNVVSASPQVQYNGVISDSHLTLEAHIKSISNSAFFHLRNIARIKPFLSLPDAERLVHARVTSSLDYCNALYFGLPAKSIKRLQHIQNSAARVLTHTPFRQHISGVLRNLHWLPVHARIDFKILILTYKAVHGTAPSYLCDLITPYMPSRSLRSTHSFLLKQPSSRLKTMGERAFSVAAPGCGMHFL